LGRYQYPERKLSSHPALAVIFALLTLGQYDDIRTTLGFKNVTLANRMAAKAPKEPVPFIPVDEIDDYNRRSSLCSTITTAIHELLGHGTGLLLAETEPGVFNFDRENPPISPIDGKPISTWYRIGQTWGSVFGGISGSYEECRAECTVLWLAAEKELLKIFGCRDDGGDEGFDESE
jgi:dipeptidyl-peptidase-3